MGSPASSDEGEIRDGVEKATTTLQLDGTSVDRPDRSDISASKSPQHRYRSRDKQSSEGSRSPYSDRQPRGSKRGRDDDYPDRSRDPRRFKVHYEDAPRRSRGAYEDLDRPSPSTSLRYDDDQDRYSQKRPRTRSRSPYRASRGDDRRGDRNGYGGPPRRDGDRNNGYADSSRGGAYGKGDGRSRDVKDQSVSKRRPSPLPTDNSRREAKSAQGFSQQHNRTSNRAPESEK